MSTIEESAPAVARAQSRPDRRRRARMAAVAGGVLAALAIWVIAEVVAGVDLRRPAPARGTATQDIDALHVAFAAAAGSLAGWALLALLERTTGRARRVWIVIAVVAFIVSLGGPLSGTGITSAGRMALLSMHVAVAAAIVPALYRTSPATTDGRSA